MRKPQSPGARSFFSNEPEEIEMKGLVAWWLGVPVVVIVILYLTGIF
ncbi:hypothetical protein [Paracoccus siganidrum]|nr:hypothetical protein [Paracoccus siganidrum]